MKKSLLFVCSFAACMAANAATANEVVDLYFESSNFHQTFYESDGDWYNTVAIGDYEFMFDIVAPEGLISGNTYTYDDMLKDYSFGIDYTTYTQIKYESASYTETITGENSKDIEIHVVSEDGVTYNLIGSYTKADEPEMMQMPEGIETLSYTLSCVDLDFGEESFEARLAFDGDDVYLEGCGYVSYFFQSVIKGTKSGNSLIFPAGQCVGFGSTANYFIYGFSWDTFALQDIVFNYDEELNGYVCESEIVVTPGMSDQLTAYYEFISEVVLTSNEVVSLEAISAEKKLPAKRFDNGKLIIRANGMSFDAAGLRQK